MNVFPIFLNDLGGRRCVVFGGGHEAERKAGDLLDCGADVTLVSPTCTETLRRWAEAGRLAWLPRSYRPGDLRGTFLAIASETNPAATEPIWREAEAERVLLNALDDVPHCSFVSGSVVRRGDLVLSISTSGCAPALSVRLRQAFEDRFGDEYATFLSWMGALRGPMAERFPDFEERRAHWYALVDSDVLDLLRAGDREAAHRRVEALVGEAAAALLPA
jgi:siroheme synthase-like protein